MTFDEWMLSQNPQHKSTDDHAEVRLLRQCWMAASESTLDSRAAAFLPLLGENRLSAMLPTVARLYKKGRYMRASIQPGFGEALCSKAEAVVVIQKAVDEATALERERCLAVCHEVVKSRHEFHFISEGANLCEARIRQP